MGIAIAYSVTASSVTTTEKSCVNNSTTLATTTTAGLYQLWVDLANVANGDEFEIALLEKVVSGGTQRRIVIAYVTYAIAGTIFISDTYLLANGWDFSIKKIAGTNRNFDWTIRAVT